MRKNLIGNLSIAGLIGINALLWLLFMPQSDLYPHYAGQVFAEMLSSSALVLFACVLVLSNRPKSLEPYFGGLDRMYVSHKNSAILAVIVIVFHQMFIPKTGKTGPGLWLGMTAFAGFLALALITVGPRVPLLSQFTGFSYHGWRRLHRFMGLFFIFGVAHMLMVEPLLLHSPVLTAYVGAIAGIGVLAYLYREFLWHRLRPSRLFTVQSADRLNANTLEVALLPQGEALEHRAGQFLFVHFEGEPPFIEPHPFTISSAPKQNHIRLAIKASGDWTGRLYAKLKPGVAAHVDGPYGMFDYKTGGRQQVWVAGGIGVTPFLSWVRDFDDRVSDREIDFFYTVNVPGEALYLDEIREAAARHNYFRVHANYSSQDGRLSVEKIVASSGDPADKDIYMCGPFAMVEAFRQAFRKRGVPANRIHFEEFNFR
jgi:predicted ferric reductase